MTFKYKLLYVMGSTLIVLGAFGSTVTKGSVFLGIVQVVSVGVLLISAYKLALMAKSKE